MNFKKSIFSKVKTQKKSSDKKKLLFKLNTKKIQKIEIF